MYANRNIFTEQFVVSYRDLKNMEKSSFAFSTNVHKKLNHFLYMSSISLRNIRKLPFLASLIRNKIQIQSS